MSIKNQISKFVDRVMGKPHAPATGASIGFSNRKARRTEQSMRMAAIAAPRRMKFEKRGAPNRSSKGRRPFRV